MNNKKKKKKYKYFLSILLVCFVLLIIYIVGNSSFNILSVFTSKKFVVENKNKLLSKAKEKNSSEAEAVSWLSIEGTNIDLPVLKFGNIDSTQPYDVKYDNYAWLEGYDAYTNHVVVFGHNIRNLSSNPEVGKKYFERFDNLMAFVYYDFAKDNQFIQYTVDGKDHIYKIFSVYFTNSVTTPEFYTNHLEKEDLDNYTNDLINKSIYNYNINKSDVDSLLILSTCTRFFGDDRESFVIVGYEVKNDKFNKTNIKKNDIYKDIEKILKGSESDEKI